MILYWESLAGLIMWGEILLGGWLVVFLLAMMGRRVLKDWLLLAERELVGRTQLAGRCADCLGEEEWLQSLSG